MIRTNNQAVFEPAETALRLLLEARQERVRTSRGRAAGTSGSDEPDDWQSFALEQLADGVLFIARKNHLLQDEIRSLREEIRRLRARLPAA